MDDLDSSDYLTVVVDFGRICRLCLQENKTLVELYEQTNSDNMIISKVEKLMGLKIIKNEVFPPWICQDCLLKIENLFEFTEMCRESQETLSESYLLALNDAGIDEESAKSILNKSISTDIKTENVSDEEKESYVDKPEEILEEENSKTDDIESESDYCEHCMKEFPSSNALLIHKISVHQADLTLTEVDQVNQQMNILLVEEEPTPKLCKFCGANRRTKLVHFETAHRVDRTLLVKHTEPVSANLDCPLCLRPFFRHSALRQHIMKAHDKDVDILAEEINCDFVWTCSDCEMLFPNSEALKQHSLAAHNTQMEEPSTFKGLHLKELFCSCGVVNLNKFEAMIHDHVMHGDEKTSSLSCPACQMKFESSCKLKTHLISYHAFTNAGLDLQCVFCSDVSPNMDSLKSHVKEIHDIVYEARLEGICKPMKRLKKQKKSNVVETDEEEGSDTGNDAVKWLCSSCGKAQSTEIQLKRHVLEYHSNETPIKCPECSKVFPRKMNLHNHYKRRHLHLYKGYICSFCGVTLKGKAALISHENGAHKNIRDFKCAQCPEAFTRLEILKKHEQRHMAVRPMHQCPHCEKRFTTLSGYDRHVKTHEGVKEHVCDMPSCGKSFYTKFELRRHVRYHNRDFKHICTVCGNRFMTPGELKKHSTKHTGDRPYQCHMCHCAYSRRDDKVRHLKRVHNLKVKKVYGKPTRTFLDGDEEVLDNIHVVEPCEEEEEVATLVPEYMDPSEISV